MNRFFAPILPIIRFKQNVYLCKAYNNLSHQLRDAQDDIRTFTPDTFTQAMTEILVPLSRYDGRKALNMINGACDHWAWFSKEQRHDLLTAALSTIPEIIVGSTNDAESKLWVANQLIGDLAKAHGQDNLRAFDELSGILPNGSRVCLSRFWECGGDFSFVVQRVGDYPTYALANVPITGNMSTVNMSSIIKYGTPRVENGMRNHLNETFMIRARDVISSPKQPMLVDAFRARAAMCTVA